jgi:hypothetical protein
MTKDKRQRDDLVLRPTVSSLTPPERIKLMEHHAILLRGTIPGYVEYLNRQLRGGNQEPLYLAEVIELCLALDKLNVDLTVVSHKLRRILSRNKKLVEQLGLGHDDSQSST